MKTAEEIIIEKVGDFWWICGKHQPKFLEAMYDFAKQYDSLPEFCVHGFLDDKFCDEKVQCKRCFDKR
jgi:hypothetical protein